MSFIWVSLPAPAGGGPNLRARLPPVETGTWAWDGRTAKARDCRLTFFSRAPLSKSWMAPSSWLLPTLAAANAEDNPEDDVILRRGGRGGSLTIMWLPFG